MQNPYLDILDSDEAYAILDRGVGDGTWLAGGCLLLSRALRMIMPDGELIFVMGTPRGASHDTIGAMHVVLRAEGKFWDGRGAQSEEALLDYWRHEEMLYPESVRIATFDETLLGEIVSSHRAEVELAALLLHSFGHDVQREFVQKNLYIRSRQREVSTPRGAILLSVTASLPGCSHVVGESVFLELKNSNSIQVSECGVHERWRRLGIATAMYDYVEKTTSKGVEPGDDQTDDAEAFWAARELSSPRGRGG